MTIVPNEDFIKKHYAKTVKLLQEYGLDALESLVSDFQEEYAICPASTQRNYYSAFPGGLSYHNLHVLQWLSRLAPTLGSEYFNKVSLLKVAILHEFGKVGLKGTPYYIRTTERWKEDKGIYYDINPDIPYMKVSQRSLFLAQEAGVKLTTDEYLAILLADGQLDETNSHYKYKEPKLATLLQYAVYWSRALEKEKEIMWP